MPVKRRHFLLVSCVFLISFIMFYVGLPHRKRHGDPNYVAVHNCLGLIYTSGQCKKLSIISEKVFDGKFVRCDSHRGTLSLHNEMNGEVLRLNRRPNLFFYPGTNRQSLVVDVSNGYIFLTGDGLISNFRRATDSEVEVFKDLGDNVRVDVSEYW